MFQEELRDHVSDKHPNPTQANREIHQAPKSRPSAARPFLNLLGPGAKIESFPPFLRETAPKKTMVDEGLHLKICETT